MKYLPLIWSGICRKRGRAILTALQVLVAFALFGLLQGMKSGIEDAVNKLSADLYIVRRDSSYESLPLAMFDRIRTVPGVAAATYESFLVGTYQRPTQQLFAIAADVGSALTVMPDLTVTKQALEAMKATRTGALVSDTLARRHGWKIGDRIPLESQTQLKDRSRTWTFDVVGTFIPGDQSLSPDFMIINYAYFDEARRIDKGSVQQYYVKVADPRQGPAVARSIDRQFANSSEETRTESLREAAQTGLQSLGDLEFAIRAIVGAVFFGLVFSTTAMMMQSIRERTAELAVLKTVGFSDARVFWIVLAEALALCTVAAAGGLALAAWLLPVARSVTHVDVAMPVSVAFAGLGLAALLSVLTAAAPAMRARRLQVFEALAGR
ncbi:MAG TPA: FtsX-like permease family protein [Steroidobacteraceae bacterium]